MPSNVPFKYRRLTAALWLALAPMASLAAESDWTCTEGKDKWDCKGQRPETASGNSGNSGARAGFWRQPDSASSATSGRSSPGRAAESADSPPALDVDNDAAAGLSVTPLEVPRGAASPPPVPIAPRSTASAPAAGPAAADWVCRPGEKDADEDAGWNCTRGGPPVTGAAAGTAAAAAGAAAADEQEKWSESGTFTPEDEQRFSTMLSQFPVNPWKNACVDQKFNPPLSEFQLTAEERLAREKAPTEIRSDYFEMFDNEVVNFSGGAELAKADQKLQGDFVSRNTVANTVSARGNVLYSEKGMALTSDSGFLRTNTSQGVFRNSQFLLPAVPSRGTARVSVMDSSDLSRHEGFTYTACPPGDDDWRLHASNVKINKETGIGSARNAWMEFKGVPFFFTPYMSFPVDKRRMSGFLSPSFGTSTVSGFSVQIPYYLNIAPNFDLTVTPRYLTERGFQLKNEFRYLTPMTRGRIYGDVVPHDMSAAAGETSGSQNVEIPVTRGQVGVLNDTRFTNRLTGRIVGNYVSDPLYLNQLGSPLALIDRSNIFSYGYLNYQGDNYSVKTQVDYFQSIDPNIISNNLQPYFHLPQVLFNYGNEILGTGLMFEGPVQIDSFDTEALTKTKGQRLRIRPRLFYPLTGAAGFLIPSVALQHNQYWLENPEFWGNANAVETESSESFTVPVVSLDGGLYFDRDFELGGTPMLQTLEPRLFYNYIPYTDQTRIPVFDTTTYDFTFYQLFRENRFVGNDRVGDANQLTVALTSQIIDQATGLERLRASIGNIFYFRDRLVTLNNAFYQPTIPPPQESQFQGTSNLVGEVGAAITEDWSFRTGGQYNPDHDQIERGIVALQYNDRRNHLLNLAYRYRVDQTTLSCDKSQVFSGCLNLTDVSARLPITDGWFVIGRWQYSILDQLTLESFGGIERETCCWRFALIVRKFINNYQTNTDSPQSNFSVFVQFEFKGLGNLGEEVDRFLARSMSGYRYKNRF
jgi:LPS-assembly protein